MIFELSLARKYLTPKKNRLSVSLIALLSVGVISVVVWLVLVFLSITEGIEKNWLNKLTALNAPLRITPTPQYFNSYYYQIDHYSHASGYHTKTIGEKTVGTAADPYDPTSDSELPPTLIKPKMFVDPVRSAYEILTFLKKKYPSLAFQDYEVAGATMRLQLLRSENPSSEIAEESQTFLTQISYLCSFADNNPAFKKLLLHPTTRDLNQQKELLPLFTVQELKSRLDFWKLPLALLPERAPLKAIATFKGDVLSHVVIPQTLEEKRLDVSWGQLVRENSNILFKGDDGKIVPISAATPLIVQGGVHFKTKPVDTTSSFKDLIFEVSGKLQGTEIKGNLSGELVEIASARMNDLDSFYEGVKKAMVLSFDDKKGSPIILAKSYQDAGVLIGDTGYLSYPAATASSVQEQRMPIYVAGFYDPGVMAVGNRCILTPMPVVRSINRASNNFNIDKSLSNGIQVWFSSLDEAPMIKAEIEERFQAAGIAPYWKVASFREYEFAKDLLEQFQSDKTLFSIIGLLILLVACTNIISLLFLLVGDKKHEIGILQAMGASKTSIAVIFGTCGALMGVLSSLIGTGLALLTLNHIDLLVNIISTIQGHTAFNAAFFGKSLPKELSSSAVQFVLIATPILSLLAALIPALRTCRMSPSTILRSE